MQIGPLFFCLFVIRLSMFNEYFNYAEHQNVRSYKNVSLILYYKFQNFGTNIFNEKELAEPRQLSTSERKEICIK